MKKLKVDVKVIFTGLDLLQKTLNEFQERYVRYEDFVNNNIRPAAFPKVRPIEHNSPPHKRVTLKPESPTSTGDSSPSS